jgi:putative acetyltransferase
VTEIKLIQQYQLQQAKQIIITVCLEIWQGTVTEEEFKQFDSLSDIDNVQSHYFDNRGMFLVLVDAEQVVGTGAIRQLDNEICELKRMWFLKEYRGQGFGRKMAKMLFDFARQTGYQKVRLDLANEERQSQALKFYKKLGFYLIERYNDSSCTVFMEKML